MVYTPTNPETIFRLLIALDGIEPPIWRLVDVPATLSLSWLHDVLQWAFGWEHRHRYFFYRGEFAYVEHPTPHEWSMGKELDANQRSLAKVFGRRGRYIEYVYDMGANWRHHIWLENVFAARPMVAYPRLIDGARACPPEGIEGVDRYAAFLAGALDADHDLEQRLREFNPEAFDPSPRPFPNARILATTERAISQASLSFDSQAGAMLGALFTEVEELLGAVDEDFRADLGRALEDLVLCEDLLPPLAYATLEEARQESIGIESFLIQVVEHYEELGSNYSFAPLHAARVLAQWALPQAEDTFLRVLKRAAEEEEGTVDTMIEVLTATPSGCQQLLYALDELAPSRRLRAVNALIQADVKSERLFTHLKEALALAGPDDPRAPYILSFYDDRRSRELLRSALDDAIEPLSGDLVDFSDEELADQADYALFLAEMVNISGGEVTAKQRETLQRIEDFFWSASDLGPGYAD